jgi:tape measure domain-containing protein
MPDIYKLQGAVEVNTGRAEASLKKVESSARGTQTALSRINGRKVGSELAGGFDRGAQSASRLSSVVSSLQAKINSMRGANLKFGSSGGAGGGIGAIAGGNLLSGAISAATGGLADKLKQGWSAGIEYNKMLEKANISFTTLLGSTAKAQDHLAKLQAFGEATPFEFPDLIKASQRMQAMGFDAQNIIPTLKNVGDAVSAVGGGKEELDGVVMALGQMQTKGKVSAEEMNQLAERGIPAWDLLAKAIGKTKEETIKLSEQGRLSGPRAVQGITAMMGERFGGQMDKMSATLEGQESNFNDVLNRQLGQATKGNFDQLKQTYGAATKGLGTEGAKAFGAELKTMLDKTGNVAMGDLSKLANGQLFSEGAKTASGVNSALDSLGGAGKAFSEGNYYDAAKGVGAAIGKGLEMGLKNSQDPIDRAVYDFFSSVITQSKSILGIQSPSKVYEAIGVDTVAGFAVGLEAGKGKMKAVSAVDAEELRKATLAELEKLRDDPRIKAMLDVIAKAEGTGSAYNMQFGGGRFSDLSAHPNEVITRKMGGKSISSTAAGRYQFLNRTWTGLEKQLGLTDFGAKSQDLGAIALMKSRGMIDPIMKGDISGALTKGNREWASLPGSPYGQPTKSAETLITAYNASLEKYNTTAAQAVTVTSTFVDKLSSLVGVLNPLAGLVVSGNQLAASIKAPALKPAVGVIPPKPGDGASAKPFTGAILPEAQKTSVALKAAATGAEKIAPPVAAMAKAAESAVAPVTASTKALESTSSQAGKFADAITEAGNATKEAIDHFANFKDSFASGFDDLLENGFNKDSLKSFGKSLLKELGGGLISQATGGKANSVGGLLSNALFGGGGGGPFTGGFAGGPGAGGVLGGSGGGSVAGAVGGQVKNSILGGVTGKLGGWLGKIPGIGKLFGGGASAAAGAGGQAAGGILGKVGGFLGLGGPAGLVAGIGLSLAAPLLGKLFGGNPLKDYKKLVKGEYGVSISDQMAGKIYQIGQSKFGAEASKRKIETVRLPEVRDMLSEYAGAFQKGGNGKLFDSRILGDQFSAANQFAVMRAGGGSLRAGQAAIVGERRAELFIPRTDGTVLPFVPGQGKGMDAEMMAEFAGLFAGVRDALNRFSSMPADQVLMTGAARNPDVLTDAVDRSFSSRSDSSERLRKKLFTGAIR